MATFQTFSLDKKKARRELKDFRSLLDGKGKGDLGESADILPFFTTNMQLCILMGMYNPGIMDFGRISIAREFDIFGDHVADLAIGDAGRDQYCFIEFEDAKSGSIFKSGRKTTPEWSTRYEHGYSQLIDWILWIENNKGGAAYRNRFGSDLIYYNMLLIIGRDRDLATRGLRERFDWRSRSVVVASKTVFCITLDKLYDDLETRLTILS